jgi:serine/threonine-protein kinase
MKKDVASPSAASWAALTALGAVAALWALFLWGELVLARAGGTPFCSMGGGADCAAVWDSGFASGIHLQTGLPIAAWGLAWGLVAGGLPLVGLLRLAEGRPLPALISATRVVAAAGAVTVFVMLAVSAAERAFCPGCFVTYALVAGYAGVALFGWQSAGLPERARGLGLAAGATAVAFLLLLYPGIRTPRKGREAARAAIAKAGAAVETGGDAERDRALREMVASLDPALRQTLSDSLDLYRRSAPKALPAPRALLGPVSAPVRITEFTDVLCEHCADLARTLGSLRESLPPETFSVDARQFPLDGECNPLMQRASNPVRCLAAKAKICFEGRESSADVTRLLFENQEGLRPEKVFALTAPYMKRRDLEACLASPETAAKLGEDIQAAAQYDPDGTPIVVVNGRQGTSFGPFLYAVVLTAGADAHPAFDSLPPPNPRAHLH